MDNTARLMNYANDRLVELKTLDYVNVAANLAPVLVPLAPMTLATMTMADSLSQSAWAYGPAIVTSAGAEMVGMVAAHLLTAAILNRHAGRIVSALALLAFYAVFVVAAVSQTDNALTFASYVFLSVVGYLAGAQWRYNAKEAAKLEADIRQAAIDRAEAQAIADHNAALAQSQAEAAAALALAETQREILMIEAQSKAAAMKAEAERLLQNAVNRGAKISAGRPMSKGVQNGQKHAPAPRPENVEAVRVWFAQHENDTPKPSDREAARALKLSPSTVKACKDWIKSHEARPAV